MNFHILFVHITESFCTHAKMMLKRGKLDITLGLLGMILTTVSGNLSWNLANVETWKIFLEASRSFRSTLLIANVVKNKTLQYIQNLLSVFYHTLNDFVFYILLFL